MKHVLCGHSLSSFLGYSLQFGKPQSSGLWRLGPLEAFFQLSVVPVWGHVQEGNIIHDECRGTGCVAERLKVCSGGRKHVQLRGCERVKVDGEYVTRNRAAGTDGYPSHLCNDWAQVCGHIAPSNAVGESNWHACNQLVLGAWALCQRLKDMTCESSGASRPKRLFNRPLTDIYRALRHLRNGLGPNMCVSAKQSRSPSRAVSHLLAGRARLRGERWNVFKLYGLELLRCSGPKASFLPRQQGGIEGMEEEAAWQHATSRPRGNL